MEHNDAILLIVIPASQAPEVATSRALRVAKEYDSEGRLFTLIFLEECFLIKLASNFATEELFDSFLPMVLAAVN